MIGTCLKKGVAPRIELESLDGAGTSAVEYYRGLGVKHFRIGTDVGILRRFWRENGARLQEMLTCLPYPCINRHNHRHTEETWPQRLKCWKH